MKNLPWTRFIFNVWNWELKLFLLTLHIQGFLISMHKTLILSKVMGPHLFQRWNWNISPFIVPLTHETLTPTQVKCESILSSFMLCGTRSTHHQLPEINNRAQWALLMKGEVLLPAVTFLVAFEEGAAGKREGGGHSCRATADQPQWVSWGCQRETKVKTPEALAQTSRSSPSHRSRWNNRNKEYLQHTLHWLKE